MANTTDKYRYITKLKYLKTDKKEYVSIPSFNIDYCIIDRDYDANNMPIIYMCLNIDKNLVDDIISNYKTNLMNFELYKIKYDEEGFLPRMEDLCIRDQCTYIIADDLNPTKDLDYATDDKDANIREDVFRRITIGLMKIDLINFNKSKFNATFDVGTTLINGIRTVTNKIPDILIEPLTHSNDLLDSITINEDSVSKTLKAINNIKALYDTPYRYFMDFDTTYLLSSKGLEVPRKGSNINAVLICIKKPEDYIGMDDGVFINRKQHNYQINVNQQSTALYTDKLTDKIYDNLLAITSSGDRIQVDLNIEKSNYSTAKTKTIYLPNDNTNLLDSVKCDIENSGTLMVVCKESIDTETFALNHRIIVKNVDEHKSEDGDYLMTRKREIFVREGSDFILSTMVNLRKIR